MPRALKWLAVVLAVSVLMIILSWMLWEAWARPVTQSVRLRQLEEDTVILRIRGCYCTVGRGFEGLTMSAKMEALTVVYEARFADWFARQIRPPLVVRNEKGDKIGYFAQTGTGYSYTGGPAPLPP